MYLRPLLHNNQGTAYTLLIPSFSEPGVTQYRLDPDFPQDGL